VKKKDVNANLDRFVADVKKFVDKTITLRSSTEDAPLLTESEQAALESAVHTFANATRNLKTILAEASPVGGTYQLWIALQAIFRVGAYATRSSIVERLKRKSMANARAELSVISEPELLELVRTHWNPKSLPATANAIMNANPWLADSMDPKSLAWRLRRMRERGLLPSCRKR
jgi:hypothetical protein